MEATRSAGMLTGPRLRDANAVPSTRRKMMEELEASRVITPDCR